MHRKKGSNDVIAFSSTSSMPTAFTSSEIERNPLIRVQPQSVHVLPKPGTGDWATATDEMVENCECALQNLRRSILERRIDMKPEFKAFSK